MKLSTELIDELEFVSRNRTLTTAKKVKKRLQKYIDELEQELQKFRQFQTIYLSSSEINRLHQYIRKDRRGANRYKLVAENFAIWDKITVGEQTRDRSKLLEVKNITDPDVADYV